jgi:hypothetical protein
MTTTLETHTFNFTPASIVQRTLASFSFRKDAVVTIGLADGRLYFQAEADDCTLRTSQSADWCAPGAQFAFAVEARIATKLHTLFPYAVQACYGDDTFSISHENSTIQFRAWPAVKSPVCTSNEEVVCQPISSKTLKSALDFILPFANPNRLHREDSDVHFQGNAIISGKATWAAAIVTFATDFTPREFSLSSSGASRLRSVLGHMSANLEILIGSESIQFSDENTTISLTRAQRKYPPAETLLRRAPTSKHMLKPSDFIKSLMCHSALLRPSHAKDTATMTLKYDPACSTELAVKVKNNIVPGHLCSRDVWAVTGDANSSSWVARTDLAGLLTFVALDDAAPVSLAPMSDHGALYVGQNCSDFDGHVLFANPAPTSSYARAT